MKRREFGQQLAGGVMAAGIAGSAGVGTGSAQGTSARKANTLMHVGGDYHSVAGSGITSKENLEYNLRCGVRHLTAQVGKRSQDGGWDIDELKKMKDDCDKHGVNFEAKQNDISNCVWRGIMVS
jgi:hypothetical protein